MIVKIGNAASNKYIVQNGKNL